MNLILGAGIAGLSASFHLGHEKCLLVEKDVRPFGHARSTVRDGMTWDDGPHVSFTRNPYVRDLFAKSVQGSFVELEARTRNYFHGHWIDHPAQTNLYQVPEPIRSQCLDSFLKQRNIPLGSSPPKDYREWLHRAFGPVFAETFPIVYTRKYWTLDASMLTVDWIGSRMYMPQIEEVLHGARGPLGRQTHYITQARYPAQGGFEAFARHLRQDARIHFGMEVESIDLLRKQVRFSQGQALSYDRLINTIPLPDFIQRCVQAPEHIKEAAGMLRCSRVLLVNVIAPHPAQIEGHWFYVYDPDKTCTRIHVTEHLSPHNGMPDHTGIQVEAYLSPEQPHKTDLDQMMKQIVLELCEMGFVRKSCISDLRTHHVWVPWANIIFDQNRRQALESILDWLSGYGLGRESSDLDPMEDWNASQAIDPRATLFLAGRFGQWKYFWSDDCVLRGRKLGEAMS